MVTKKHPCIFRDPFTKEVNARLYEENPKTPFGAFQRAFRTEHCATLNPYGSESCPYPAQDCVLAYYVDAGRAMRESHRSPVGLFRLITRRHAAERADNKPLARETIRPNGHDDGSVGRGDEEGRDVRARRLRSIGDLFGDDDL